MAGNFIGLRALGQKNGDWSAKVQVLTKMTPRVGMNSRTTYQKILLCDAMGDCAEAVIYNNDVELFEHTLKVGRTYVISNSAVSLVNEKFKNQLTTCQYQLTINSRTSVLDVENDGTIYAPPSPVLLDRTEFVKEIGSGTKISTVCVIIAKRLPRRMFLKERENLLYEYAAVDQNFKPFVISIWQDTVPSQILDVLNYTQKLPVFMLLNFTVTDFYGVCLSSTSQSVLHHEYDNSSFREMLTWRDENEDAIIGLIKQGGLFEEKLVDESVELQTIKQVLDINKEGKYNIFVKARLSNTKQKFYYMCCETCNYGTTGAYNSNFTCRSCAVTSVAKPRFRCSVNVYDDSGDLDVVLFGNDVEQIMGLSVTEVYEIYCEGKEIPVDVINARMDAMWFRLKIRGHPSQIKAGNALSYNVVYIKCYEGDYEKCKELAADKDPESSAYDVSKKETDVEINSVTKLTHSGSSIGHSNASDIEQKRRRLMKMGKRVVMSDDEQEDIEPNHHSGSIGNANLLQDLQTGTADAESYMKKEFIVNEGKLMQSDESNEPTLAAIFKKKASPKKSAAMEKRIGAGKGKKVNLAKKLKTAKVVTIPDVEVQIENHLQNAKKENNDGKGVVKKSTRGRIIKPKILG